MSKNPTNGSWMIFSPLFDTNDYLDSNAVVTYHIIIVNNTHLPFNELVEKIALEVYEVSYKEFIKEAFNHPEWPSIQDLHKHYEKETNKKDI